MLLRHGKTVVDAIARDRTMPMRRHKKLTAASDVPFPEDQEFYDEYEGQDNKDVKKVGIRIEGEKFAADEAQEAVAQQIFAGVRGAQSVQVPTRSTAPGDTMAVANELVKSTLDQGKKARPIVAAKLKEFMATVTLSKRCLNTAGTAFEVQLESACDKMKAMIANYDNLEQKVLTSDVVTVLMCTDLQKEVKDVLLAVKEDLKKQAALKAWFAIPAAAEKAA